jgi:hypothetical protein
MPHLQFIDLGAQESLDDKIVLKPCEKLDLTKLRSQHDYLAAANSTETMQAIEESMNTWIKQIEQVQLFYC